MAGDCRDLLWLFGQVCSCLFSNLSGSSTHSSVPYFSGVFFLKIDFLVVRDYEELAMLSALST